VLQQVQDFARRRPGAFLATALAAGFVVGRLGKGVVQADPAAGADAKPSSDTFVSSPPAGYPDVVATEYASTGTGIPVVVDEVSISGGDYPGGRP
jgi:hypothetical protein